jgi:hypothetical protein
MPKSYVCLFLALGVYEYGLARVLEQCVGQARVPPCMRMLR